MFCQGFCIFLFMFHFPNFFSKIPQIFWKWFLKLETHKSNSPAAHASCILFLGIFQNLLPNTLINVFSAIDLTVNKTAALPFSGIDIGILMFPFITFWLCSLDVTLIASLHFIPMIALSGVCYTIHPLPLVCSLHHPSTFLVDPEQNCLGCGMVC